MPHFGKVIGTLWATRKYEGLEGATLQLVQPTDSHGRKTGRPLVAVDTAGAGPGETIFYVTAYEAVIPFWRSLVPIDASIVGIVERIYHEEER